MNTYEVIYRDDTEVPTFRNGVFTRGATVAINAERYELLSSSTSGTYINFLVGEEVVASVYSTPDMIVKREQV